MMPTTVRTAYLTVIAVACIASACIVAFAPRVEAASEEVPVCDAAGTAEGQTLYSCIVEDTLCVWDPSPTLGAGVLDCDW